LEEADVVAGMEDLKLTSKGGRALTLTPEQLRTMTRDQLIGIWKDYVNQLAVLLVELERGDTPAAGETIKQYIEEVVSTLLIQSVCFLNGTTHRNTLLIYFFCPWGVVLIASETTLRLAHCNPARDAQHSLWAEFAALT